MLFTSGFSAVYLLISAISLVLGMAAAINAHKVHKRLDFDLLPEERYELEKQVYLVITLMGLGLLLRLFLVPLWFITLSRLMPTIPGAMCLTGVHMASPMLGFSATALKFMLPLAYGYWLVLNYFDRRMETHPFMLSKLTALIPILGLMAVESFIDNRFLMKFEPEPTACCTSIFDVPRPGISALSTWDTWGFVVGFYLCLLVLILLLLQRRENNKPIRYGIWSLTTCTPVFFIIALHTKISPLFLQAPYHHCIFCLWQRSPDSAVSTILVVVGTWLLLCYLAITSSINYHCIRSEIDNDLQRLSTYAMGMMLAGGLSLGTHLALVV
jgi:hypothetical protein